MTNIYARLVFLGAALVALTHGCSDASVRCLGNPVECGNRSPSNCISGCELRSGCLGEAVTCESVSDNTVCDQTPGCELRGNCEGERSDGQNPNCAQLAAAQCRMTAGCRYSVGCFGEGTACDQLEEALCGLYPQCAFQRACVGRAEACDEVDSFDQCQAVPGCYLVDTDPSVVR